MSHPLPTLRFTTPSGNGRAAQCGVSWGRMISGFFCLDLLSGFKLAQAVRNYEHSENSSLALLGQTQRENRSSNYLVQSLGVALLSKSDRCHAIAYHLDCFEQL